MPKFVKDMKTKLFIAVLSIAAFATNAQFNAGNLLLTGDFNFGNSSTKFEDRTGNVTTSTDGPKQSDFNISASGGYFLKDNLAVGLGLGFGLTTREQDVNQNTRLESRSNVFVVAPFVRYYIPYTENFAFFGDFSVGVGFGNFVDRFRTGNITTEQKGTINPLQIGITPGFNYLVHRNIGLEIRYGFLGYSSLTVKEDGVNPSDYSKVSSTGFGLNFGLNTLNFGIIVFL